MTSHATIKDKSQSPLAGVLVCCTAIPAEERGRIAAVVQQMGGVHKLDLTSDVTHLIAGDTDTPKYKYVARERPDIKVVRPEWIDAVRASWMEGGDTDVAALEEEYKLPAFAGLRICVTGFEDAQQRSEIASAVTSNGAEYHGDLTKIVTHLVAAAPEGKKYEHAVHWRIKVVSTEWVVDSLQRGMVLDEACYNPLIPRENRGDGAINQRPELISNLGKRQRQEDLASDALDFGRRKLRRTASAKLGSQSDSIWADLGSATLASTKVPKSEWNDQVEDGAKEAGIQHQATKASSLNTSIQHPAQGPKPHVCPESNQPLGIFQRKPVIIFGFDHRKTSILQEHLTANAAVIVPNDNAPLLEDDTDITAIVPHDIASDQFSMMKNKNPLLQRCRVVTEWWVERCLHRRSLIEPSEDILSRPIRSFPIPEFSTETICPTSFTGVDLLHFSKLVKLLGAKYDESLNPSTTVLVCNKQAPNPEKLIYAVNQGITVVSVDWVWDCLQNGKKSEFTSFLLANFKAPVLRNDEQSSFVATIQTEESSSFKEIIRKSEDQRLRHSTSHGTPSGRGKLELVVAKSSRPTSSRSGGRPPSVNATGNIQRANAHPENRPKPNRNPFREDEDSYPEPLGDIPPEVNSPSKRSESASVPPEPQQTLLSREDRENRNVIKQESDTPSTEVTVLLPGEERHHEGGKGSAGTLNEDIALLLAEKKAAIPSGSDKVASLRHRPLGRAMSNPSSLSALSRSSSQDGRHSRPIDLEHDTEDDMMRNKKKLEDVLPSQILSYEDPDAHVLRENLMKRMGIDGVFDQKESGMKRVESIGLVKDSAIASRVGNRKRSMRKK